MVNAWLAVFAGLPWGRIMGCAWAGAGAFWAARLWRIWEPVNRAKSDLSEKVFCLALAWLLWPLLALYWRMSRNHPRRFTLNEEDPDDSGWGL